MPEPLLAWAAVAPDGKIKIESISHSEQEAWVMIGCRTSSSQRHAYRVGWRVVPVEIRVMEDGGV